MYHTGRKWARTALDDLPARPPSECGARELMRYMAALLFCFTAWASGQQTATPPNPCTLSQQQQLSFWVGEWDLTWPGNRAGEVQHGTNSVHRVLDSCVVEEN